MKLKSESENGSSMKDGVLGSEVAGEVGLLHLASAGDRISNVGKMRLLSASGSSLLSMTWL